MNNGASNKKKKWQSQVQHSSNKTKSKVKRSWKWNLISKQHLIFSGKIVRSFVLIECKIHWHISSIKYLCTHNNNSAQHLTNVSMQLHFKVHCLEFYICIDEYMKFTFLTCLDMMVFFSFAYQINTKYIKLKAKTKYFNSMLEIKKEERNIFPKNSFVFMWNDNFVIAIHVVTLSN